MTSKTDIAAKIAAAHGVSQAKAESIVSGVFDEIAGAVKAGEVRIAGFGIFGVSERKAGTGRNPRTGAKIEIAAKRSVKFRAAKALNAAVGE